ncbi:uncharacterized protein LOC142341367 [Convolutriloba macropyga]|uniref:uncharacterized protein LOC142341367 n=1 Tax=Convolutriloba macropyga TaxID=536237 RepID=UPI003F5241C3
MGCSEVFGGFQCENCLLGAQTLPSDPTKCKDIDECSLDMCGDKSLKCENRDLSYTCTCQQGYQFTGDYGTNCSDVDECGVQKCGENSTSCTNEEGSYLCECEEGFWFDQSSYGSTCQRLRNSDVNRCDVNSKCGENSLNCSFEEDGSLKCECKEGFWLDKSTSDDSVCRDLKKTFENIEMQGPVLILLKSYLSEREQCLKSVKYGVLQGSVLGPLLFLVYIDDIQDFCGAAMQPCLVISPLCFSHVPLTTLTSDSIVEDIHESISSRSCPHMLEPF